MKDSLTTFLLPILIAFTSDLCAQSAIVKVDLFSSGHRLNADLYYANAADNCPTVILLHGFPGHEGDQFSLGKRMSSEGINVLIFNFRGLWSSEGTFSFENSMEDIDAAISFLKKPQNIEAFKIDTSNITVIGYSLGGSMALTAAIYNPKIKNLVSIAGVDQSVIGRKMLADDDFRLAFEQRLKSAEHPAGPLKCDTKAYVEHWLSNLDKFDPVKNIDSLAGRNILLVSGRDDLSAPAEQHTLPLASKLMTMPNTNAELKVFETNHQFGNVQEELADDLIEWILGLSRQQ
jgi:pimeloyl-ACP methyl ester carboxylesterase